MGFLILLALLYAVTSWTGVLVGAVPIYGLGVAALVLERRLARDSKRRVRTLVLGWNAKAADDGRERYSNRLIVSELRRLSSSG